MIELGTVKAHLRVFHGHEDAYIQVLVDAAAQAFNDQTNRLLVDPAQPLPDAVDKSSEWPRPGSRRDSGSHADNRPATENPDGTTGQQRA